MQIFISYRRDDASGEARNLYERLGSDLGRDNIFYDREGVRAAEHYRKIIEQRLNTSDIVLLLIGESWLAKLDDRIENADDDLHIREVRHALEASKVVIPVLLKRAQMPRAQQLPAELREIVRRQATSVREDHWDSDVDQLIARIHELAPPTGLDSILRIVRKVLNEELRAAVENLRTRQEHAELSVPAYYTTKERLLREVPKGHHVWAVNILHHQEWQFERFARDYLAEESRAINRGVLVTRFFVGSVKEHEDASAMQLIERTREAGARVRRVYIDEAQKLDADFDQDIGFHETQPQCLTQGLYAHDKNGIGIITHARVSTKPSARNEAKGVFEVLNNFSPALLRRSKDSQKFTDKWVDFYENLRWTEEIWSQDVSRILHDDNKLISILGAITADGSKRDWYNIIDLGCGEGVNARYCLNQCDAIAQEKRGEARFRLRCIDVVADATRRCDANLKKEKLSSPSNIVEFDCSTRDIVEEIPAVTGSVDLIYCMDTFSNLDPLAVEWTLKEWRRVLRTGGHLIFNAYRPGDPMETECREGAWKGLLGYEQDNDRGGWWAAGRFFKFYTQEELRSRLENAYFSLGTAGIYTKDWSHKGHPAFRTEQHEHHNWVVHVVAKELPSGDVSILDRSE